MAFITALPLSRPSARRAISSRRPPKAELEPVPPLNGDKALEMKEKYPISKVAPLCRCWQSKDFPRCDGSHNAFNKETGSHVGPIVVSVQKE